MDLLLNYVSRSCIVNNILVKFLNFPVTNFSELNFERAILILVAIRNLKIYLLVFSEIFKNSSPQKFPTMQYVAII